jgi:glycosyltransferase involved in cell wall biosynthesis
MVVLEAWSQALPVICLGLGGPGRMVDGSSGRVIRALGRSELQCGIALGDAIVALGKDESLRLALARGACERYQKFSWQEITADLYGEIGVRLGQSLPNEADRRRPPQVAGIVQAQPAGSMGRRR